MNLRGFTRQRRTLSDRLARLLVELFRVFTSWGDRDAGEFARQAVPLAEGARRTMADLTAMWIAQQATTASGIVVPTTAVPDEALARPGVTSAEVYRRPFTTVRAQMARGADAGRAVRVASSRLETIAEGDMQRAHTQAASVAIQGLPPEAQPIGWRRVLHGEENCPMCVVASTQLYPTDAFSPSHPRCDCGIELAYANDLPMDDARKKEVAAAFEVLGRRVGQRGGVSADDYADLLAGMVREHGELGPLLVRPSDNFTSQADLPA